jgi:hypothetical protein
MHPVAHKVPLRPGLGHPGDHRRVHGSVHLRFLVTHQDAHTSFIPQVSLITSWFVILAAFGFLVFYSHRVAALIQNPDAVGRIVDDIRRAAELAGPRRNSNDTCELRHADIRELPVSDSGIVQSPTRLREFHIGQFKTYKSERRHEASLQVVNSEVSTLLSLVDSAAFQ